MASRVKSALFGLGIDLKVIRPWDRARFLGLSKLDRSDVFMCSYPRSGNTWTRMIVACLLDPRIDMIDLDLIDQLVPECGQENARQGKPRVFKEHIPKFDVFPRVLYNYRDGRDSVVSAYRYAQSALDYDMTMRQYIVDRRAHDFGLWHEHVGQALDFRKKYPDRICMVGYEKLRAKPEREVARIAEFLGVRVAPSRISQILEMTNLKFQKRSKTYEDPRKRHTLQAGRIGGWRDVLSREDLEVFEGLSVRVMDALGYTLAITEQADSHHREPQPATSTNMM